MVGQVGFGVLLIVIRLSAITMEKRIALIVQNVYRSQSGCFWNQCCILVVGSCILLFLLLLLVSCC